MTLALKAYQHVNAHKSIHREAVQPASVWDCAPVSEDPVPRPAVRTLTRAGRTQSYQNYRSQKTPHDPVSFERRRENGRDTLLGLAVGLVLAVGTVVGINEGSSSHAGGNYETVIAVTAK